VDEAEERWVGVRQGKEPKEMVLVMGGERASGRRLGARDVSEDGVTDADVDVVVNIV